jgi:hypothetical protein
MWLGVVEKEMPYRPLVTVVVRRPKFRPLSKHGKAMNRVTRLMLRLGAEASESFN